MVTDLNALAQLSTSDLPVDVPEPVGPLRALAAISPVLDTEAAAHRPPLRNCDGGERRVKERERAGRG